MAVKNYDANKIASLKQQDKEYNESFRKWRIEHKKDYGFYFNDSNDEYIYRDGEGFIGEYPKAAEDSAISMVHNIICWTVMLFILLSGILVIGLPYICERLGYDVTYCSGGFFAGERVPAVISTYALQLLPYFVAFAFIFIKLKMPLKVLAPLKINNRPLFNLSIPAAVLTYAVTLILALGYIRVLGYIGVRPYVGLWIPQTGNGVFLSCLLNTILIPIINELLCRGVIVQMLRQFGDGYAIFGSALVAATISGDVTTFLTIFTSSLVVSYFMLRTGSVLTAIIMHIIMSTLTFWSSYMEMMDIPQESLDVMFISLLIICIIVGLYYIIRFMKRYSDRISLPMSDMYLTGLEKMMNLLKSPLCIILIAVTFASAVFTTKLV
ncbi:MAG: lysostaphin resistance A-like protein [Huintestinicola sp.]